MRSRADRSEAKISGRVNSDGSIASGFGFQARKNATGDYRLRFPDNFVPQSIRVTPYGSYAFATASPGTQHGEATVAFSTTSGAGTPVDAWFNFEVSGRWV